MNVRINDKDGIDKEYGPMINFFNALNDRNFIYCLELFSRETGFGNEYHICSFASNWHPQEEGYFESGVQFIDATGRDKERMVIVDYSTFYKHLKMACDNYLETHSEEQNKVEEALKSIRDRYNVG